MASASISCRAYRIDAEGCPQGHNIRRRHCIHVRLFDEMTCFCFKLLSGIGEKFQTHCVAQRVFGDCWYSEVSQGRASCVLFSNISQSFCSFVGLSGLYFSLQYLSLSDSTALTFITPILTGFSGAIFLKEPFSTKQTFSGGKHPLILP